MHPLGTCCATSRRRCSPRSLGDVNNVAFANGGKTLLVADPTDDSGATGIDGNRNDTSKTDSGALWLY